MSEFTVIITGSRDWADEDAIVLELRRLYGEYGWTNLMILKHGGCLGADKMAARVAAGIGWTVEAFEADWGTYGNSAGPKRNQEMVDSGADLCLAFPLPGSKGTWDCINRAVNAGIRTIIVPRSKQ